jgi:hypothetical protein
VGAGAWRRDDRECGWHDHGRRCRHGRGALTLQSVGFLGAEGNFATYLVDLTSSSSDRLSILGDLI